MVAMRRAMKRAWAVKLVDTIEGKSLPLLKCSLLGPVWNGSCSGTSRPGFPLYPCDSTYGLKAVGAVSNESDDARIYAFFDRLFPHCLRRISP